MSFLSTVGKDFKAVFTWIGSPKGQAVIGTVEAGVEVLVPASTGIINLANSWMSEIIKTETLAAAAGSQSGTGTQKAAATITAVTPEVLQFAAQYGLTKPTSAQIATASSALVTFLNAFDLPVNTASGTAPNAAPVVA